jgi:fructokinase
MQYVLIVSPKKVIIGGGVMKQTQLLPMIRNNVQELLNGYVGFPQLSDRIDEYIVSPGLGDQAGIIGSLMLAKQALAE